MATLPKSIEAAWSNTYDLTVNTNYKVNIWKDSITLEQTRVTGYYDKNVWTSSPENRNVETTIQVKLGKIERNESNIEALERCKSVNDIFNVFGYYG